MLLDLFLTNLVISILFFISVILLYLVNTEWIGFGFVFIWNLFSNAFFLSSIPNLNWVIILIGFLLFTSLFLVNISIAKLHSYYNKKSEPIKNFPERKDAFNIYKIIYIITQFILLGLIFWLYRLGGIYDFTKDDFYTLIISTVVFLIVYYLTKFGGNYKITGLFPFFISGVSSIFFCFLGTAYFNLQHPKILLLLQSEIVSSLYLSNISFWIYNNSQNIIG